MEKITRLSSLIKRARDARLEGKAGEGEDKASGQLDYYCLAIII